MQCIINFNGVGGKNLPIKKKKSVWSSKTCYIYEILVEK